MKYQERPMQTMEPEKIQLMLSLLKAHSGKTRTTTIRRFESRTAADVFTSNRLAEIEIDHKKITGAKATRTE